MNSNHTPEDESLIDDFDILEPDEELEDEPDVETDEPGPLVLIQPDSRREAAVLDPLHIYLQEIKKIPSTGAGRRI